MKIILWKRVDNSGDMIIKTDNDANDFKRKYIQFISKNVVVFSRCTYSLNTLEILSTTLKHYADPNE